ncbi:MAG: tetratricopeptide repeat protein [Brumimicrobium sp.]|nr:tetratricopeptide repeat protein [Brumimicrobium sp.]
MKFRLSVIILILCILNTGFTQENDNIRGLKPIANNVIGEPGNTYAVIVGISTYPNLSTLNFADKDALLFADFLQSNSGGNVPAQNIKLLLNEEATSGRFWGDVMDWVNELDLKKGDRIYFYFAGHGDGISASQYFFLMYDCNAKNKSLYRASGTINIYNLKEDISDLINTKGADVILIMDACRTGDLAGGREGLNVFTESLVETRKGEKLMLSASSNQVSYEGGNFWDGHGLFTYYLIKGLSGNADQDGDQIIDFYELEEYVKREVRNYSKQNFPTIQIPTFDCSKNCDVTLSYHDKFYQEKLDLIGVLGGGEVADTRGGDNRRFSDTTQYYRYQNLLFAIKQDHFKGSNSAHSILEEMIQNCPVCETTLAGKVELAVAYLNYGQAKINLYVSGINSEPALNSFKKKMSENNQGRGDTYFSENISRLEKLQQVEFQEAAQWMHDAIKLLGTDSALYEIYKGKMLFLDLYSQRLEINPNEKEMWINKIDYALKIDSSAYMLNLAGLVYSRLDEKEKAIQFYKSAIEQANDWVVPINNLGVQYFNSQDYKNAETQFLKCIEINSSYELALQNLTQLYIELKEVEAAESLLLKRFENNKASTTIYSEIADFYRSQKEYKNAETWYLKGIEINPSSVNLYNNLGSIYTIQKDYESAKTYFNKVIAIDSNYLKPYLNLGIIAKKEKDYVEALNQFYKVIEMDSSETSVLYHLGMVYFEQKDYKNAEDYFLKFLAKNPSSNAGMFELIRLYHEEERYQEEIEVTEKLLPTLQGQKQANYKSRIGWNYYLLGDLDSALSYCYMSVLESAKYLVYPYENLCAIYFLKNQMDSVEYYIQKVEANYEEGSDIHFRSLLYKAMSTKDETIRTEQLNEAMQLITQKNDDEFIKKFKIELIKSLQACPEIEDQTALIASISKEHICYEFIMDYKPFLKLLSSSENSELEDYLRKIYNLWN